MILIIRQYDTNVWTITQALNIFVNKDCLKSNCIFWRNTKCRSAWLVCRQWPAYKVSNTCCLPFQFYLCILAPARCWWFWTDKQEACHCWMKASGTVLQSTHERQDIVVQIDLGDVDKKEWLSTTHLWASLERMKLALGILCFVSWPERIYLWK